MAGLSAAVALGQTGHTSTLVEQAAVLSEVGAGIQLGPNATRILIEWGLGNALSDAACEPTTLVVRDARDDRVLTSRTMTGTRTRYGAPHLTIRRADLQNLLLQGVQQVGAQVLLGQTVQSPLALPLKDYDALLGCDGIRSRVREELLANTPHGGAPHRTGYTAHRIMLDWDSAPASLQTPTVHLWLGDAQHVVAYPVKNGRGGWLLNVVAVLPSAASLASLQTPLWVQLRERIQAQGGLTEWPLLYRPPMLHPRFYAQQSIALLGDAAHPMHPFLAQGAAMAIEDAQALAQACVALHKPTQASIHAALQTYAQARWRRNAQVQRRSRMQGYIYHASGLLRLARNAALQLAGGRATSPAWLYDYQNALPTSTRTSA